jgi:hypothetical protein
MPKESQRRIWVPPAENILQLKVTLRYIQPPIWRRIAVPDNFTLGDLHYVIQTAMGWHNCHLHGFRIGKVNYEVGSPGADFGLPMGHGEPAPREDEVFLSKVFQRKGQRGLYEYDFGDGWLHEILVEKIIPASTPHPAPVCLAGKRACPPEDCGSYPGYANVLRVLKSAETDDDREFREWVGEYDPEHFDMDAVNRQLRGK